MTSSLTRVQAPNSTRHYVSNKSSRNGSPVLAVCLHSTESNDVSHSIDDLVGIRNWFNNSSSQASAHVGIDGDGHSEVWVPVELKAWTALDANPWTANIEFVGRAAQPERDWEDAQVRKGAMWVAYWSIRYDIPIKRGRVSNLHGQCVCSARGIITHLDVTRAGFGTHTDPGSFPISDLIKLAREYKKKGWPK